MLNILISNIEREDAQADLRVSHSHENDNYYCI